MPDFYSLHEVYKLWNFKEVDGFVHNPWNLQISKIEFLLDLIRNCCFRSHKFFFRLFSHQFSLFSDQSAIFLSVKNYLSHSYGKPSFFEVISFVFYLLIISRTFLRCFINNFRGLFSGSSFLFLLKTFYSLNCDFKKFEFTFKCYLYNSWFSLQYQTSKN